MLGCVVIIMREIKTESIYNEDDRMWILGALTCVGEVVHIFIEETEDKILAWKKY